MTLILSVHRIKEIVLFLGDDDHRFHSEKGKKNYSKFEKNYTYFLRGKNGTKINMKNRQKQGKVSCDIRQEKKMKMCFLEENK